MLDLWAARDLPIFRDKLEEMVVSFLSEASVLVAVFGILDFGIKPHTPTSLKVVIVSLGIAALLFMAAVIVQLAVAGSQQEIPLQTAAAGNESTGAEENHV